MPLHRSLLMLEVPLRVEQAKHWKNVDAIGHCGWAGLPLALAGIAMGLQPKIQAGKFQAVQQFRHAMLD